MSRSHVMVGAVVLLVLSAAVAVLVADGDAATREDMTRRWIELAGDRDLERLRDLRFASAVDDDSDLRGLIAAIDERGGVSTVRIGRTLAGNRSDQPTLSAVCTRIVTDSGQPLEGGLRFILEDGRWVPWEWLQLAGCQGEAGDYPRG